MTDKHTDYVNWCAMQMDRETYGWGAFMNWCKNQGISEVSLFWVCWKDSRRS